MYRAPPINQYLDMTSGIGVVNVGHSHPLVIEAAKNQCDAIVHAQANTTMSDKYLELLEVLEGTLLEASLAQSASAAAVGSISVATLQNNTADLGGLYAQHPSPSLMAGHVMSSGQGMGQQPQPPMQRGIHMSHLHHHLHAEQQQQRPQVSSVARVHR
jgi:glutamate-1-semialdehyde aminotransferase